MLNSTSNTYILKREILTFSNIISKNLSKPDRKFTADMTYGMLSSGSCLLTDVVDQLHEPAKKVNSVERLTRHLNKGIPAKALNSYLSVIRKWIPDEPVIHIDDSDIIKPDGYKFEALGTVRDGRLALWEAILIFRLQFTETQAPADGREIFLPTGRRQDRYIFIRCFSLTGFHPLSQIHSLPSVIHQ